MEKKELTARQKEILNYIKKYSATHGFPPAIREICKGVGLKSPATVFTHLRSLENAGFIKTTNNKFRTIEILSENEFLPKKDKLVKVPLIKNKLKKDWETTYENTPKTINIPAYLIPAKASVFIFEAPDNTLVNEGILKGDYLIIKKDNKAHAQDFVLVLNNQNELILKKYTTKDSVVGKIIGLYRKI